MKAITDNPYYILPNSQLFPLPSLRMGTFAPSREMERAIAAAEAYQAGSPATALEHYTNAINAFPDQPFFYACRSLLNSQLGDEEGAFYDYQVAKVMDFNYHHFMEWKENEGEMEESVELLELDEQLRNSSLNHQLYINRAMLHVEHYCYQEAVDDFSTAFALHSSLDYLISRAAIYTYMLRYGDALDDLNRAIGGATDLINTNSTDLLYAYLYRGKLYAGIKDLKRAEKDLDYCIAKDPSNKVFREDRALFYERNGFRDKAIADYSCLIELDPDDFFPYVVRADLYKETDQVTLALADYDKAIALNPYYSDLYQYRAELRERLGDPLGARLDLQKYEELEDE